MTKLQLQSKIKNTGTAYILWFLLGVHYAYLGKWGIQLLFWITGGGLLLWWIIDLFLIPGKVDRYNANIFQQIEVIDKREKEEDMARQLAMIKATKE